MVLPVAPTAALSAVEREDMGKASGVNSTLQRFGGAFGVAVATSVFAAFGSLGSPTAFMAGFRPSFTMVAGLAVVGALAASGVGSAQAAARASSSPEVGGAPALSTLRAYDPSTEAREPGTAR